MLEWGIVGIIVWEWNEFCVLWVLLMRLKYYKDFIFFSCFGKSYINFDLLWGRFLKYLGSVNDDLGCFIRLWVLRCYMGGLSKVRNIEF